MDNLTKKQFVKECTQFLHKIKKFKPTIKSHDGSIPSWMKAAEDIKSHIKTYISNYGP